MFLAGYTPLYVALKARQWETAKLIMEIAAEQKEKDDDSDDGNNTRPSITTHRIKFGKVPFGTRCLVLIFSRR